MFSYFCSFTATPTNGENGFDTTDAWFDSSRHQFLYRQILNINCIEKTKINKKEARIGQLLKNSLNYFLNVGKYDIPFAN